LSFSTSVFAGYDTTLPSSIIDRQSDANLRAAALSAFVVLAPAMDTTEGSFAFDLIEPFCLVLAQAYADLVDIERRNSLATATGLDLDRLGDLYGVVRTPPAQALGTCTFSGQPGSAVGVGTLVSTVGANAQTFRTTLPAVIGAAIAPATAGSVDVPVVALDAGAAGNVPAGSVTLFAQAAPQGVGSVTNKATMVDGADLQADGAINQYYLGYRADIYNLENTRGEGGAAKHLRKWARAVPGVGHVQVLEVTPTAGWATLVLLGVDGRPASVDVVHAVEAFILDPWYLYNEAESVSMVLGGAGAALDSQADGTPLSGTNNVVRLHGAAGTITQHSVNQQLGQPGVWRLKPRMKVDSTALGTNLVTVGMYNTNAAGWCYTRPVPTGGTGAPALLTLQANKLSTAFIAPDLDSTYIDFNWDGNSNIELRIALAGTDTTTTLWIDEVNYFAAMSRDDRDVGLSPAGMRVNVVPATPVTVNIAATITYALTDTLTAAIVNASVATNLAAYFLQQAVGTDHTIRRASVEDTIYQTTGVGDVNNVTLNGATNNIQIGPTQVAVIGSQIWTAG
jgi:uncharacterized phage protein gp47/JayE